VTKLRLDSSKRVRVRDGEVAVMLVRGAASASLQDTVAGRTCHGQGRVSATGIGFKGDSKGVLLRIGVAPSGDPFKTACRAPTLDDLGETALPSVRLTSVRSGINKLRLRVDATRGVTGGGYTGTLKSVGTVALRAGS
jgi:hypothetical protein